MNKGWIMVITGSLFEVGWVIGLKYAAHLLEWAITGACIVASFYILLKSGQYLPVGTAYAVFVGLGTLGTVLADITIFGEGFRPLQLLFILAMLAGVMGLQFITTEAETKRSGS